MSSDYRATMKQLRELGKRARGRARGETHGAAKFTNSQVKAICDALNKKIVSASQVAEQYNVSENTIYSMWRGKTYKDVER